MAHLLRQAVEHADNFRAAADETLYQFRVFDHAFAVGYMRSVFARAGRFDPANFRVDHANRTVTLSPAFGGGRSPVQACDQALVEFCEQNTDLCPGFAPWLGKPPAERDWHGILGMGALDAALEGLRVCTPLRGVLGVATAGVHCTAYQTRTAAAADGREEEEEEEEEQEVVDTVWLSRRGAGATFPLAPDNFLGGAMDPEDGMDPVRALRREAEEEAGMVLCADGRTMLYRGERCGELRNGMQTLSVATLKGAIAGPGEDGHVEFAVRFAFDMCLVPGFTPRPHDADVDRFLAVKAGDIERCFDRPWKYSSGAVMVDWVLRNDLIEVGEAEKRALQARLHRAIPLRNVQRYLE